MANITQKLKNARITKCLVGVLFVLCILIFAVVNLLLPDKEISEQENRTLAGRPALTLTSILSGDFMDKFETYQSDQFVGRDSWRKFKTALDRFGGANEENGVLIGKNGQLMEDIVTPDPDLLQKTLQAITAFTATYPDVSTNMMLVPDAATVLEHARPSFCNVTDQEALFTNVKEQLGNSVHWIDMISSLKNHTDEKIYYKTDHHWTSLGAFYAFSDSLIALGIDADAVHNFTAYPVSSTFNGTLSAKAGCGLNEKEEIDIYVPQNTDSDLIVNYVDDQKKTASLYDSAKLSTRDQYGVFLGGNTSLIDITTVCENTRRLLVIKDSFANSFLPFLTPYFREIVVVDPRYYSGTIKDIMDTYRISDAIFLYSGNTFFQDTNLNGMLTAATE